MKTITPEPVSPPPAQSFSVLVLGVPGGNVHDCDLAWALEGEPTCVADALAIASKDIEDASWGLPEGQTVDVNVVLRSHPCQQDPKGFNADVHGQSEIVFIGTTTIFG